MNSRDGDKKQLPVVLPPVADELLSSWIARHGAFYNVSPRAMLRHAVPNARSLRAADDHLTDEQGRLLAHIFRRELSGIRRMTFVNIQSSARRLIAAEAIQTCQTCAVDKADVGASADSAQLASGLAHHLSRLPITYARDRAGGRHQQRG